MTLVDRLRADSLPDLLRHLGIEPVDRGPISAMVGRVLADREATARVQEMAMTLLLPHVGSWRDTWQRPGFDADELHQPLMAGALPLCALLATAEDVHQYHLARGIVPGVSWASLADMGQQISKHRLVRGQTGLTHFNWLRNVWAGDFIKVGRLQFELYTTTIGDELDHEVTVLNTHIAAEGSMSPSAVDAALLAAPGFFASHFADQVDWGIDWIFCMSWLLDPQLVNLLPGSNIADFASRWEVIGGEAQDRDGYYFVFNIEPEPDQTLPLGLDDLPQRSSLERALVSHWRSGGHLVRAHGRIPAGRSRTG